LAFLRAPVPSRLTPLPPGAAGAPGSPAAPGGLLVANLLAQIAYGLLAMTICIPSMQQWGAQLGASQSVVGLTFSAYLVTYGAMQLLYGPVSDRRGRKTVLLTGLALAIVGSVAAALAPTIEVLIAARVLQGAGTAAGAVVGRAMVQDLFQGPERTRVMAWVGMAMGLCPPLATVIGGQLHVRLGWQANFVLMTAWGVLLWLAAWRGLPDRRPDPARQPSHWLRAMGQAYARLAREPAFVLYALIVSSTASTFYAFLAGAPIVLGSQGVGPDGIGWYIMVTPLSYILGNYLTTRWVRRLGERRIMLIGQAVTVFGIVLMLGLALAGWHHPLAFALPLVFLGSGHGLLVPPALAGTVGLLPALAGAAAAVVGVMQQVLGAAGGYAVSLLTHEGAANLGWLMLGIALVGVAAQVMLRRLPR